MTDGLTMYAAELSDSHDRGDASAAADDVAGGSSREGRHGGRARSRKFFEPRRAKRATTVDAAEPAVSFEAVPHCPALRGEAIQDATILCTTGGPSNGTVAACEALALHSRGRRVTGCALAAPPRQLSADAAHATKGSFAADLAQRWLRTRDAQGARAMDTVGWLLVDSACVEGSGNSGAAAAVERGCISVGTRQGRVAQLRFDRTSNTLFPLDAFQADRRGGGSTWRDSASLRPIKGGSIGSLQSKRLAIRIFNTSDVASGEGDVEAPKEMSVLETRAAGAGGFCVGGGHVYVVGRGQKPQMWRFPLPPALA